MERLPHPVTDRGMPYVPLSIYEIDCGGEQCGRGSCPDTHHLFAERKRFAGQMRKLACAATVELKRCQHNELHARYEPAPEPPRETIIQEIGRYGIT